MVQAISEEANLVSGEITSKVDFNTNFLRSFNRLMENSFEKVYRNIVLFIYLNFSIKSTYYQL